MRSFINFYSPPNILKIIESMGMRWMGHVDSIRKKILRKNFV
jgi:hypothetical protein